MLQLFNSPALMFCQIEDILSPNLLNTDRIGYTVAARAMVTAMYAAAIIRIDCERVRMFVSKPIIKNAIEFARKAAICQKIVTASFVGGSMAERIVKLPKYNPATATAINPDAPTPVAKA